MKIISNEKMILPLDVDFGLTYFHKKRHTQNTLFSTFKARR